MPSQSSRERMPHVSATSALSSGPREGAVGSFQGPDGRELICSRPSAISFASVSVVENRSDGASLWGRVNHDVGLITLLRVGPGAAHSLNSYSVANI